MSDIDDAVDEQVDLHLDDLAEFVMDSFRSAESHRNSAGISETITDSLMRYRGKYTCDEAAKFQGVSTYVGLTGMLVRSAVSWLKDAYFNAQDRPWTLDPTPSPELPASLQAQLDEAINVRISSDLGQGSLLQTSTNHDVQKKITELRNTASDMAFTFAKESADAMATVIEDQLIESDFRDVLSEFLFDVCIFPFAVLKGPVIRNKLIPVWKDNEYAFDEKAKYSIERVDPSNFYFSPDSKNTQDGEYVIETMTLSRARLNEAKGLKDFDADAINLLFNECDLGYRRYQEMVKGGSDISTLTGVDSEGNYNRSNFEIYEYHGRVSGEHILTFLELDEKLDEALANFESVDTDTNWGSISPYEDYEVVTWVSNGIVLMLRENASTVVPYRPYYVTSCYKVPGSPYGESVPMVIADLQDDVNTAARARKYNMGMSSGPLIEVDISRFPDNKYPSQIQPWQVYPVQTNSMQGNNAAPAIRATQIPNHSNELTHVLGEAWDRAHSVAGIPPYMYGENKGAAQTLGAFSLQYAGATKGIKTIISNIDHDIIEKLIRQMYYYNMYYHEDTSIKADVTVNVRGAAGLIAQEQRQARPLELLQALGPILAQMQPETALALANETLSESGYDPATLGLNTSNAEKEASNRLVGENTQAPPTDGRSGDIQSLLSSTQAPVNGSPTPSPQI